MNPEKLIELYSDSFTKSDLKIKDYIIQNMDIVASYPIMTVAEKAGVSKSALLRFCQKLGYQGYSEFKYEISRFILSGSNLEENSESHSLEHYIEAINLLPSFISEVQLTKLSQLIMNSNKIKTYGIHETGLTSKYLEYRLTALGIDVEGVTSSSVFHEKALFSSSNDLNIYFSLSGTNEPIVDSIEVSLEKNSHTVLFTYNSHVKNKDKFDCLFVIPTFDTNQNKIFLDSQPILMLAVEMLINNLARQLQLKNK